MKNTKKMIAILLSLLLVLSLTACGGGSASTDPNAGLYTASTVEMLGVEIDAADAFTSGFTIELKDKGRCALVVDGKKANGKWTLEGTTFTLDGGGIKCEGTLEGGVITLVDVMGMNVTLLKDGVTLNKSATSPSAPAASASTSQLVGIWDEVDIDNTYTFNADGTGEEYYAGDTWEMEWKLNGTTLTLDFFDAGVEEYEIEFVDGTLFVRDPSDDTEFEYTRR